MTNISEIFKSYDIRGEVGLHLNPKNAKKIAQTFADWLPEEGVVAVGHDMRPDSAELAKAFINGLQTQGYDVWDIGLVTSDMIYFAVGNWSLAGGAVITASHNPGNDNGIKLYRDKVIAVGLDAGLSEIRDNFLDDKINPPAPSHGSRIKKSITNEWVDHCLSFITKIKSFNIAVDAGNGMAGEILPSILSKLPLTVEEMYFGLDGTFPNHEANPQKVENLRDLIQEIRSGGLDFGIAFDGDGDRAVFVDDLGRLVLGTDLITIIASHYAKKYPGTKIVHDVRTSRATIEFIKKFGCKPIRTKAGRVNIGLIMRKVGAAFGAETTGHMFFRENYDADSGLITALVAMQVLSDSDKKLSELVDQYRKYVMPPEINLRIKKDNSLVFSALRKHFNDAVFDDLDGLTVSYPDWWFNLRASNTEPVMRLNIEARTQDLLEKKLNEVRLEIES